MPCETASSSPATLSCFLTLIPLVVNSLFNLIGAVTLFMMMLGGFRYITAGGDEKQLDEARKILVYAAAGLAVVIFSFFILNLISIITGVSCLTSVAFTCSSNK